MLNKCEFYEFLSHKDGRSTSFTGSLGQTKNHVRTLQVRRAMVHRKDGGACPGLCFSLLPQTSGPGFSPRGPAQAAGGGLEAAEFLTCTRDADTECGTLLTLFKGLGPTNWNVIYNTSYNSSTPRCDLIIKDLAEVKSHTHVRKLNSPRSGGSESLSKHRRSCGQGPIGVGGEICRVLFTRSVFGAWWSRIACYAIFHTDQPP